MYIVYNIEATDRPRTAVYVYNDSKLREKIRSDAWKRSRNYLTQDLYLRVYEIRSLDEGAYGMLLFVEHNQLKSEKMKCTVGVLAVIYGLGMSI